ncbi:MAG: NAD(P)H-dependent oxidoreductase [Clostridiales bacterium]|nr:NAD(P)H-dependent oxidoreductase [Clostridiales bacterium]
MILLLNGSFRGSKSNSNYFLDLLEKELAEECERVHLNQVKDIEVLVAKIKEAGALVIGMPLYVDGAPAQIVELMETLYSQYRKEFGNLPVYIISNLGFYESTQIGIQLEIVKNWCSKMEFLYGGGLAVGAGEMLGSLRNVPPDKGPNRKLGEGVKKFAAAVSGRKEIQDIYVGPAGFPRRLYIMAAHMGWRNMAKQNKLVKRELYRKRV